MRSDHSDQVQWRSAAVQFLPDFKADIYESEDPYMLWICIRIEFFKIYDDLSSLKEHELVLSGIYRFARWCYSSPRGLSASDDLLTCVFVCFYEHICENKNALADITRWIDAEDFSVLSGLLLATLNKSDYERLSNFFVIDRSEQR